MASTPAGVKPVTRYRKRDRDPDARAAHTAYNASWRRTVADSAFNADDRAKLLKAVRSGKSVAQAAGELDITTQAVYGRARWDSEFSAALDAALSVTLTAAVARGRGQTARRVAS